MNKEDENIEKSIFFLKKKEIVALPTESVYGLSAIVSRQTIQKIAKLKRRSEDSGFIIVSGSIQHLLEYVDNRKISEKHLNKISIESNKNVITWVVPVKKEHLWLTGRFCNVAIRLTKHNILKKVTERIDQAIISTSANITGLKPARKAEEVKKYFKKNLAYIYPIEKTKMNSKPSKIINILSEKVIRQ